MNRALAPIRDTADSLSNYRLFELDSAEIARIERQQPKKC